jgi:hypothetical protein
MDPLNQVLGAISHPTRRAVIARPAEGPARVTEISQPFAMSLNAISKHLKVLFYRLQVKWGIELPHYGCFTTLDRPRKIYNTWMSRHTRGLETIVAVSFAPRESGTLQELNQANIPDDELGLRHKPGWEHYLGVLANCFGSGR